MNRTLEFPLTKLYPDWTQVRVKTPDGPDSVRQIVKDLEATKSNKRFGIIGTGTLGWFIVFFEDKGDATWFALKGTRPLDEENSPWLKFKVKA